MPEKKRNRYSIAWRTKQGRTVVEEVSTRVQMVDRALTVARRTSRGVQLFYDAESIGYVFGH